MLLIVLMSHSANFDGGGPETTLPLFALKTPGWQGQLIEDPDE